MNIHYILTTQYNNLGDTLINQSLITKLAKTHNIFVDGKCKSIGKENGFLPTNNSRAWKGDSIRTLSGIMAIILNKTDADFFVATPGAQSNPPNFKSCLQIAVISFLLRISKFYNKKSLIAGISFEDLKSHPGFFYKLYINSFDYVVARDYNTHKLHQGIVGRHVKLRLIPDLAFISDEFNLRSNGNKFSQKVCKIAFSFRSSIKNEVISSNCNFLVKWIKQFKMINFEEISIEPVIQVSNDVAFMRKLCADIEKTLNPESKIKLCEMVLINRLDEASSVFSSVHCVITNRLHVYLNSILSGTPAVIICSKNYNTKCYYLMNDLGLSDWILHPDQVKNCDVGILNFITNQYTYEKVNSDLMNRISKIKFKTSYMYNNLIKEIAL